MRIPIELKLLENEILSSWLIRNSIANGSEPSSWVSGIWHNFRAWTRDIDRHLPKDKINKLSKITSLSREQIRAMTLEPIFEKITSDRSLNPKKTWLFVIPTGNRGTTKINGMHFCKECFKEKTPYIRKEWRFAWNVACAKHKELLLCRCQNCNKAFSPHKVDYINTQIYKCTNCSYDLRLSDVIIANNEVIKFQNKLNDAVFNDIIDTEFPILEKNQYELFSTIRAFISFFKYLKRIKKRYTLFEKINFHEELNLSKYPKGTTFESMSVIDRQKLLLLVSKLFTLNIDEIKQLLTETHISKKTLLEQVFVTSKTLDYLAENLVNHNNKISSIDKSVKIKPRSKDEVEALMDEIRPFI
ncbi:MAG: TniQ family protein [Sulfurimonas sp.]|jgi:hypothetical protein